MARLIGMNFIDGKEAKDDLNEVVEKITKVYLALIKGEEQWK